jgi:tetraacyldisaccharide 4'-kinase
MQLRRRCAARRGYRSTLKIVCVGNIHSGGSGKTPLVMELARRYPAVILSRGYRGKLSSTGAEVDRSLPDGFMQFGDESWMMANELDCPVWTGKNRARLVKQIEQKYPDRWVILDDGFQHLALARKADLVVISADKDPLDSFCLPHGDLREPFSSLSDASAIIVISNSKSRWTSTWLEFLRAQFPQTAVFSFRRVGAGLWDESQVETSAGMGLRLCGFCGIGNPQGFQDQLADWEGALFLKAFPDHMRYTDREVEWLILQKKKLGADFLVTTDKDWVKVASQFKARKERILRLRIRYEIPEDFWYFLDNLLE